VSPLFPISSFNFEFPTFYFPAFPWHLVGNSGGIVLRLLLFLWLTEHQKAKRMRLSDEPLNIIEEHLVTLRPI